MDPHQHPPSSRDLQGRLARLLTKATRAFREASSAGLPAEQELVSSLSWLIRLRWLAGLGMLLVTCLAALALRFEVPAAPLALVGLGILAYNAVLRVGLRWLKSNRSHSRLAYQWFARAQIGLDWVSMAVLIHFSGGIESPAIVFYLFHITIASLLLPHDRGFVYVSLAPILVGGVALLEYTGRLPHVYLIAPAHYGNARYVVVVLFFFACAAYAMAYFSMFISRRLRRRENEISGLYQSVRDTTSTLDLSAVLNRLTEATVMVLACKAASIRLLNKARTHLEMVTTYGLSDAYMEKAPIDLARARIDQEALSGRTVLVPDAPHDPRIRYPAKVRAEGIRTILSAPLIGRQGPIGVLRAYGGESHRFSQDDADFLGAVAAHGAVAIENAQAYQLLAHLDQEKSQFVRMVTHELRSPAQVTQSLLAVLSGGYLGDLNPQQADLVERATRRMQFLETLVDDLLDLAAGKADVLAATERGPVSLTGVLRAVAARFETEAHAKDLSLQLECADHPLYVWGDPSELDRIMNNLVSNAVKYTLRGEVRIRAERQADHACVEVADTGVGIPHDAVPHVFDEFYRASNARDLEDRGTGLGLAIVKDLVQRYGGQITVESTEGRGSTFTLSLPLADGPAGPRSPEGADSL